MALSRERPAEIESRILGEERPNGKAEKERVLWPEDGEREREGESSCGTYATNPFPALPLAQ
jgi:hypothetical protein